MKLFLCCTSVLIFYFIYGVYISQIDVAVVPSDLKRDHPSEYYDYRGVTNVRTNLSSGSSSPMEVIAEAKKAGIDFLIITDQNPPERLENYTGYHGNLLVLMESEYSYLDSRLLFYSSRKEPLPKDPKEASVFFTDLLSQESPSARDSLVVLAHPFNAFNPTWTGPYPPGLDGLEIINPKSLSRRAWERNKFNVFWSFVVYPFNPNYAFLRLYEEPTEELSLWDRLAKERKTIGFSGADASARAIPLTDYLIKFPSYQKSFEITSNHLLLETELTGSLNKDRQKIMSAFKKGQFYMALDLLGDPKGFFSALSLSGRNFPIGSRVKFNKDLRLIAKLPMEPRDFYEMIVIKNGERELTVNQTELQYEVKGPGLYRIVVRVSPRLPLPDGKKWMTWIYTNHFHVY